MTTLSGFDPAPEELTELLARARGLITEDRPRVDGGAELIGALRDARPGEHPRDLDAVVAELDAVLADGVDPTRPGELAYIPGSGLASAAVAELIAAVANRYTGLAGFAPAAVALEAGVLSWLTELFGLGPAAQAVLLSGGSTANLTALVAAREAHAAGAVERGVVYVGTHAHASVRKAARIAGFRPAHVRICPTSDGARLDPEAVRIAIKQDRADGLVPVAVVAAAGTTNAGAVDPLAALADVASDAGVWLHVDAAYGGFFALTDRGRARLAGIERADSITLDPHKSLFLPFGTGALLVRDRGALVRAFAEDADYLRDLEHDGPDGLDAVHGLPQLAELTPELTRAWRGLRLWLPLQLHGVGAFRAALDRALDLAGHAEQVLRAEADLEVVGYPDLSIVTFRVRGDDAAQDAVLARVNADGRVRLSSTVIDGRVTLRLAVLSHRTDRAVVELALELIVAAAREVAGLSGSRG